MYLCPAMRIAQLTDLHIGQADEATFEIDVRANFLRICQKVRELAPDYIVISGDLCYQDAHPAIYTWIRQQLDALEITYDLISGNHDDPILMAQVFDREHLVVDGAMYYQRQLEGFPYIFLDTTTGIISQKQLSWLRHALKQQLGRLIIFMHHPPLLAGVPHMDINYPLENRDEVLDILLDYPGQIDIFCGHYHVDKSIRVEQVNVHITPSNFFQMDQYSESFAVDHRRPGFRLIEVSPEYLRHSVIFV